MKRERERRANDDDDDDDSAVGSLARSTPSPSMDQTDLESLLATLRHAQDGSAPPSAAAAAPSSAPPSAAPPQHQLDALLSSLTALPATPAEPPAATPTRTRDLSAVSFAESVPVLNGLALDPHFLERIQAIWDEQETWELRMKDERNRLDNELKRSAASCVVVPPLLLDFGLSLTPRADPLPRTGPSSSRPSCASGTVPPSASGLRSRPPSKSDCKLCVPPPSLSAQCASVFTV